MIRTEKVTFDSIGETIVGTLYLPEATGRHPALVTDGPLTSVKEQAVGNHARAMAERGFVALAFDHRYHRCQLADYCGRQHQLVYPIVRKDAWRGL